VFGSFLPPKKATGFPCDGCPEKNAAKTQWVVDQWLCERCLAAPEPGTPEAVEDDTTRKISYSVNLHPNPFGVYPGDEDDGDVLTDPTLD
jgi:hypothetical protein